MWNKQATSEQNLLGTLNMANGRLPPLPATFGIDLIVLSTSKTRSKASIDSQISSMQFMDIEF